MSNLELYIGGKLRPDLRDYKLSPAYKLYSDRTYRFLPTISTILVDRNGELAESMQELIQNVVKNPMNTHGPILKGIIKPDGSYKISDINRPGNPTSPLNYFDHTSFSSGLFNMLDHCERNGFEGFEYQFSIEVTCQKTKIIENGHYYFDDVPYDTTQHVDISTPRFYVLPDGKIAMLPVFQCLSSNIAPTTTVSGVYIPFESPVHRGDIEQSLVQINGKDVTANPFGGGPLGVFPLSADFLEKQTVQRMPLGSTLFFPVFTTVHAAPLILETFDKPQTRVVIRMFVEPITKGLERVNFEPILEQDLSTNIAHLGCVSSEGSRPSQPYIPNIQNPLIL